MSGALVEKVFIENGGQLVFYTKLMESSTRQKRREKLLLAQERLIPQGVAVVRHRSRTIATGSQHPRPISFTTGRQDHLAVSHFLWANVAALNKWLGQALAGMQYLLTRRGPLSVRSINAVALYAVTRNKMLRMLKHIATLNLTQRGQRENLK